MQHSIGLSTKVLDTVTDVNGTTVANHYAETGQQWVELANADGIDVQNNEWVPAAVIHAMHIGMNVDAGAKRIEYRLDHATPFVVTIDYLVAFGVGTLTAGGNYPEGTVIIDVGGGGNKALNIREADGVGGTLTGSRDVALLTFDVAVNPCTVVVERLGSIIKCYLAEEPDTIVEWDMANSSYIANFTSSAFIGIQDATTSASHISIMAGVSVEY